MAFNASKTPLLKSILARSFAAQANQKFAAIKANELQTTKLPNQILVASIDQNSPVAHVAVVYRAGASDESYETQGLTRALRVGARLSNKGSSAFRVRTNIAATGGALNVETGRESVAYSLSLNRDQLDKGLRFLHDVSSQHDFRDWELSIQNELIVRDWEAKELCDLSLHIKDDLSVVTQAEHAIDALHQAAFSGGLGNLLYSGDVNVSNISANALQQFVKKNFLADRTAIVGVGIDHESLLGFANSFQLETGSASHPPSKYLGGQVKINRPSSNATVAVGTQGASRANEKEVLAFEVLRFIAGGDQLIPNGGPNSALGKVVSGVLKSPYEFQAFSSNYADTGLFGFVLTANAQEVGKAIESALKALKSGSVSQSDVETAKAALKISAAERLGTAPGRFHELISQGLTEQLQGKTEILAAIDSVSVADVNAAAKKIASGKWSIGAIGNLTNVPHVQEFN